MNLNTYQWTLILIIIYGIYTVNTQCDAGYACNVSCEDHHSCDGTTIDGGRSTQLTIHCGGRMSCANTEIICGSTNCIIHCQESLSCLNARVYTPSNTQTIEIKCIDTAACEKNDCIWTKCK